MNLLFFLTPKQDVLYIYEDFTLRQTLEKWANQRFATISVLKRNAEQRSGASAALFLA